MIVQWCALLLMLTPLLLLLLLKLLLLLQTLVLTPLHPAAADATPQGQSEPGHPMRQGQLQGVSAARCFADAWTSALEQST